MSVHEVSPAAWTNFVTAHAEGGVLDGVVVQVMPFGAFVEVADGVHGLLPRPAYTSEPEQGSRVSVRIVAIDVERKRVSLHLA